ncbi:hypothetical protein Misp01_80590 [Microtetraspora sp. NBRC 13810]|uniref:hypothetical protein n=1 Tax=Microtetraspora sp. NBRC 13810 TaxID=3030990 RepID=UPI00249FBDB4|nr:hypothetical protein [Microtetraspora sp. NBRC 13810]GLW12931.1 hypothetical protein Misp01_80590 [Microtetraspora sp. NBRC 13810]
MTVVLTASLAQGTLAPSAHADMSPAERENLNVRLHALAVQQKSSERYEDVVLSEYLGSLALASPGLTEQEYLSRFQDASARAGEELGEERDPVDLMGGIAEVGTKIPGMEGVAAAVRGGLRDLAAVPVSPYNAWDDALATPQDTELEISTLLDRLSLAAAGRIRTAARDLGADHPAVRVWNSRIGVRSGITATMTTEEFLADPELNRVAGLTEVLRYPEGDPRRQAAIDDRMAELLAANNEHIKQATGAIDRLLGGNDGAFAWKSDVPRCQGNAACEETVRKAREEAKERGKQIDETKGGLDVLVGVIESEDAESGRRAKYLGEAAIRVAKAINDYLPKIAAQGLYDAMFSLGSVMLTGNILGAIGALLPLFQMGKPSPTAQILEQLGLLRQEVSNLHVAMLKQFDAVNKNLNVVYTEMLAQFAEVLRLEQVTRVQLVQIQDRLHGIEQKLDNWSSEIIRSLQNGELQTARTALNQHLRASSGKPVASYDEYREAQKWVNFAAVTQSREAPFVPSASTYRTYADDPVAALNLYERTGAATGFLTWYGGQKYGWPAGVNPSAAERIPKAAVWLSMSNGFRRLAAESDEFAAQMSPDRAADIALVGEEIDAAVEELSRPTGSPNADGSRTNALYRGLVEDYKDAADHLAGTLKGLQDEVVGGKGYKLFGTADQAVSTPPGMPGSAATCSPGPLTTLKRPANVTLRGNAVPVALQAFPEDMRPKVDVCHEVAFTSGGVPGVASEFAVTMRLRLVWPVPVGSAEGTKPVVDVLRTWYRLWEVPTVCVGRPPEADPPCDPVDYYLDRWVGGGFQQSFAESASVVESQEAQDKVRAKVTRFLAGRQKV